MARREGASLVEATTFHGIEATQLSAVTAGKVKLHLTNGTDVIPVGDFLAVNNSPSFYVREDV